MLSRIKIMIKIHFIRTSSYPTNTKCRIQKLSWNDGIIWILKRMLIDRKGMPFVNIRVTSTAFLNIVRVLNTRIWELKSAIVTVEFYMWTWKYLVFSFSTYNGFAESGSNSICLQRLHQFRILLNWIRYKKSKHSADIH